MSRLNPLFWPTLLLSFAFFAAGLRLARPCSGRLLALRIVIATAAAIPALLFVVYYAHLLDQAAWFYAFRALPYTELTASGLGLSAGLAAGLAQKAAIKRKSAILHWFVPTVLFGSLVLLLFVPFAKPVIAPLEVKIQEQWRDGVCIQSTPSTCGPSSAATLLRLFGRPASECELARECFSYGGGTENWYIARALRRRGLRTRYVVTRAQPAAIPFPCIAGTSLGGRGGGGHFIAVLGQYEGRYVIGDPIGGRYLLDAKELRARYYLTGFFLAVRARQAVPGSLGGPTPDAFHLHGSVIVQRVFCPTLGVARRMHVYTPPGYDPKGSRRYPVLYLLHGLPGDDSNWTNYGNLAPTLDRMMANGQCEPFVVVMPDSEISGKRYGTARFERNLLLDILPFIEKTYRVRTDADHRALAGFSLGGFQSLSIGLNHLDMFAWIGVSSAGLRAGFTTEDDLTQLRANSKQCRDRLKLLYVRIGTRDFFLHDSRKLHQLLEKKAIPHVYQEVQGGHEWPVWQAALADLAPRLFR